MFTEDRDKLREFYHQVLLKLREGRPLEPLETAVGEIIEAHPEYQLMLEDPDALERDFSPEHGQLNPYLHMSLHLAIREQVSSDRPTGVAELFRALLRKHGDSHAAEHAMLEILGEAMWEAQRAGGPPDESAYLEALRGLL